MAATYTIISSTTVGSATASVSFSSIPSTYSDLILKIRARSTSSSLTDNLIPVIGTGARKGCWIYGKTTGTSAPYLFVANYTNFGGDLNAGTAPSNTFGYSELYISKYANATFQKTIWTQCGSVSNVSGTANDYCYNEFIGGLSKTAETVSSITVTFGGGNIDVGSTFDLYGIKNS